MKENTKDLIIETATKVLLKTNYQNMKTAEIAKEANISEATLYKYFDSKKDIFIEILKKFNYDIDKNFFEGITKDNTMSNNFYILGCTFYERLKDEKILYKIVYKAYSEIEDEDIKKVLCDTFNIITNKIQETIRWGIEKKEIYLKDIDVEILSMAIWGTAETVFRKHLVDSTFYAEKEDLLNLGAIFFNLLVK